MAVLGDLQAGPAAIEDEVSDRDAGFKCALQVRAGQAGNRGCVMLIHSLEVFWQWSASSLMCAGSD